MRIQIKTVCPACKETITIRTRVSNEPFPSKTFQTSIDGYVEDYYDKND